MSGNQPIRIVIVDDSLMVCNILKDILDSDPQLQVVGEAHNGLQAIELAARLHPDLITMDIQMPEMDGFAATEQIMAYTPTPILILSSAIDSEERYSSIRAISLGALDVMTKPDITAVGLNLVAQELIRKVKMLSRIPVIPHIRGKFKSVQMESPTVEAIGASPNPLSRTQKTGVLKTSRIKIVAIGASTGGPTALEKLLREFPSDFPAGIVVVQHIAPGFVGSLVEWLRNSLTMRVKLAEHQEPVSPGTVYFAPDGAQLQVDSDLHLQLQPELPPWGEHKPSVNHLFQSVGLNLGNQAIGVILTGMGDDGTVGMKTMYQNGALTLAQNQLTSLIYGMPRMAVEAGVVHKILPLDAIVLEIMNNM
jgi:two-component system, chemotaxis family, protein-glutamate methylesterase/glutaminase